MQGEIIFNKPFEEEVLALFDHMFGQRQAPPPPKETLFFVLLAAVACALSIAIAFHSKVEMPRCSLVIIRLMVIRPMANTIDFLMYTRGRCDKSSFYSAYL